MPYASPRPSKYRLRVKRSTAGFGLFTEQPIKKDEFVIEYIGPLLKNEEADMKGGKYLFAIDENLTIDGSNRKNLARYLNHSCRPNCEAEIDGKRVFIYARRAIKADEELTYHYGREYFNDMIKPYGCRCGHH
ncbi:MAG: hypothetical protein COT71_00445 [Candidatus Andersenbacteria bacterium CG10_big_fil_rev_8_21_14_0_10_54_11]|uniref:[histone H3]-lysine(4) N-trimethyltransferase n=1 Tax=Candidatus Andersenbacteria bacterium CG10_big_fil_rev_8_21_14_0_10_54_11 TaxID=1974485 RepID=A0A2M6X0B6_9BACT|nr:MAG: hypothetical protein COT71_00445 [Candidatus Andersenbacteria bacterium CG10_big_fil_rev_8_21_14_0_10_54_11]